MAHLGATAMCDVSDGLLLDLADIAMASGITVDLNPEALAPEFMLRDAGDSLGVDPWSWVLDGGEDHDWWPACRRISRPAGVAARRRGVGGGRRGRTSGRR